MDVAAVQAALRADGLDGWLLYDFHGANPIAAGLVGLAGTGKMTTRRWYYLIPSHGEPRGLVHSIEPSVLDALPGSKTPYAGRVQLERGLDGLLSGVGRVAMEYSPKCAIPYVSRVDAGTVESVRQRGVEVVSSGDLVQRFEARWTDQQLESHVLASTRLYAIKDRAFETIAERLRKGVATTELDIQQLMTAWLAETGLVTDSPPVVAAQEDAGSPHYSPDDRHNRRIARDEVMLLDLWGKLQDHGSVFADITWVGYTGSKVPEQYARPFSVICAARDAAIELVRNAACEKRDLCGWEVDRRARGVIEAAGLGEYFIHRTGHSLGEAVHGNGVHMDDYETHDDRRLLPGTGFTIEPGVYFDSFGVRTEINMYYGAGEALVTGAAQTEIVALI
ncbi:MAG: aminopeptidase P family protein [Acidobacteria bacterium]|nr:aminopeptidase P family protein [Acidobacteriota bacterium]